ncbi:MAG: aldehyde dehydrogenase family protein [Bacteriovoracaceae bacterium]
MSREVSLKSINPYDGNLLREFTCHSDQEVKEILSQHKFEYQNWKNQKLDFRLRALKNLKEILLKNQEELSRLMTEEMGKPISEAKAEIKKCHFLCEYYEEKAKSIFLKRDYEYRDQKSELHFCPIGTVFCMMPWNFPFWQVFRAAVPTLLLGNTVVLKHSENTTGCSLKLEDIFSKAGFPFTSLVLSVDQVEAVISNPQVQGVAFTGSTEVGRIIYGYAAKYIKKSVLELGGSDPYIVFKDADLELAARECVKSRLINTGQSCIAAKRILIHKDIEGGFLKALIEDIKSYEFGDPLDEKTSLGVLAKKKIFDELKGLLPVKDDEFSKLVWKWDKEEKKDLFMAPRVYKVKDHHHPLFQNETFGPIFSLYVFETTEEAISIANDSSFGLGAALFSKDFKKIKMIATHEIDSGNVAINKMVSSHPAFAFGGEKQSGLGRELADIGALEFSNLKTVL